MQNSQESKLDITHLTEKIKKFFREKFSNLSSETVGWVAILFLHGATIPGLLALMSGITDSPPPVDVVLMVWTGLLLFFIKAAVQKDMLNIITIGIGFMMQALMMMLIFFK
jgi:hypothetical protein